MITHTKGKSTPRKRGESPAVHSTGAARRKPIDRVNAVWSLWLSKPQQSALAELVEALAEQNGYHA